MRLASEILPVVGVRTFVALMVAILVVEGTPDSFEVEHVEIGITL